MIISVCAFAAVVDKTYDFMFPIQANKKHFILVAIYRFRRNYNLTLLHHTPIEPQIFTVYKYNQASFRTYESSASTVR